jgi:hypothetical protein
MNFFHLSSNVEVNPVISSNGLNSSSLLEKRREIPRFEVGAVPFSFLIRKTAVQMFERNLG